jgi:hypothetical protein
MTRRKIDWRPFGASSGLIAAGLFWAVNLQLGEMLPELQCRYRIAILGLTSIIAAAVSLLSGYVSWRSSSPGGAGWFWSRLCALAALLFAFALLLQGAAGFMLSGCEK